MKSDKLPNINFLIEEDLPSGHLLKFEKKLDDELHNSRFASEFKYLAAAVILILFITAGILITYNQYKKPSELLLVNYGDDIAETEKYYNTVLKNKMETISDINRMDMELAFEIKEFNISLKNISSDMKVNPGDERLEDAFLLLYQTQIDVLDNIIEHYN